LTFSLTTLKNTEYADIADNPGRGGVMARTVRQPQGHWYPLSLASLRFAGRISRRSISNLARGRKLRAHKRLGEWVVDITSIEEFLRSGKSVTEAPIITRGTRTHVA